MEAKIKVGNSQQVRINDLVPYPQNPRRGDIKAIAESLAYHGQYKPIVVNKSNNHILAGNHTYKAAKRLGWKTISVVYVEVDAEEARRIMLADNRLNDLAHYNEPMLQKILDTYKGNFEGTGFSEGDLKALEKIIDKDSEPVDAGDKPVDSLKDDPEVKISAWRFTINRIAYNAWKEQLEWEAENSKPKAIKILRARLGLPEPSPIKHQEPSNPATENNIPQCETVQIQNIKPYPVNPREGDIGAIVESLQAHGQYRPIVANKQTGHILAGNHTYEAAKQLGWFEVAVTWVDVDPDQELKIVLVDNRTSDLATYDDEELKKHLIYISGKKGTGFNAEDISDILSGSSSKPSNQAIGRSGVRVGDFRFKQTSEELNTWANKIHSWEQVAELLKMPEEACEEYTTRV